MITVVQKVGAPVWSALLVCAVAALLSAGARQANATVPAIPLIVGPITGVGPSYPNVPVNVVPEAVQVEDFPYITEEYFVSGVTTNGAPYTTRIIVRRP